MIRKNFFLPFCFIIPESKEEVEDGIEGFYRERAGRKGCSGTLPRRTGAPGKEIPFLVLFPAVYPFFTVFFLAIWYTETRYRVFL